MFADLFEGVLKMSETLDELGLGKSASGMIRMADYLLTEAAGADTIEELMRENPDVDVDVAVIKEKPATEGEGELFDPRLMALEFEGEEGEGDLMAQLKAIEEGAGLEELGLAGEEPELGLGEVEPGKPEVGEGLADLPPEAADLEMAYAEVDAWLKKHSSDEKNEIELDADLSSLLITAEKEVEDYLIEKNLSFEDEG